MKLEDWGFKTRMDIFGSEYNTDDLNNPKERAMLYKYYYAKHGGGGQSSPFKHEVVIRQRSRIVYRLDLSEDFDEAIVQFQRVVRTRSEPMHPVGKMVLDVTNEYLEISEIEDW